MFKLYSDGGARGNPGPSAIGAFLFDDSDILIDYGGEYVGETTNNVSEYEALLLGIKLAIEFRVTELRCHLDSELVVKQLNSQYKVKNANMKDLYKQVQETISEFDVIEFVHVPREKNRFADLMVNIILDARA